MAEAAAEAEAAAAAADLGTLLSPQTQSQMMLQLHQSIFAAVGVQTVQPGRIPQDIGGSCQLHDQREYRLGVQVREYIVEEMKKIFQSSKPVGAPAEWFREGSNLKREGLGGREGRRVGRREGD